VHGLLSRWHGRVVQASRVLSWIAVCALLAVCAAVLVDVALRWLLNRPIHGLEDVTGLIITVAIAACFPAGFGLRTNITVRVLGRALGPRVHACLEAFGQAACLVFIAAVAWQLSVYIGDVAARKSMVLGIPVAPAWQAAALMAVLAALVQAFILLVHVVAAWRGEIVPDAGGAQH
jgi:TRAP-type C4-dicarboxylate transport system permease small subunit